MLNQNHKIQLKCKYIVHKTTIDFILILITGALYVDAPRTSPPVQSVSCSGS